MIITFGTKNLPNQLREVDGGLLARFVDRHCKPHYASASGLETSVMIFVTSHNVTGSISIKCQRHGGGLELLAPLIDNINFTAMT